MRSCEVKSSPALGDPPEWHPVQCASSSGRRSPAKETIPTSPQGNAGSATSYVHDDNAKAMQPAMAQIGRQEWWKIRDLVVFSVMALWCKERTSPHIHKNMCLSELVLS